MSKPVFVLVPGAWHPPSAFDPFTKYLESKGYLVDAVPLKSVNADPPLPNFDADVQGIASAVEKHADAGRDVVLLTHSYGGNPGSSASKGLLKSQREASGKPGGIVHKIYCCSFLVPEGVSLMDAIGAPMPWFQIAADEKIVTPATPIETFYNDISDQATLDDLVKSLGPQSYQAFFSKNTYTPWMDGPSTYIICTLDKAIPVENQRGMIEGARKAIGEGGGKFEMDEVVLEASHSPFISCPEKLGDAVRKIAGEKV